MHTNSLPPARARHRLLCGQVLSTQADDRYNIKTFYLLIIMKHFIFLIFIMKNINLVFSVLFTWQVELLKIKSIEFFTKYLF